MWKRVLAGSPRQPAPFGVTSIRFEETPCFGDDVGSLQLHSPHWRK
jgi:hypothetical protein